MNPSATSPANSPSRAPGDGGVVTGHHAHERAPPAQEHPAEPVAVSPDPDGLVPEPRLDVPGEAVAGLVVVLVGIDQLVLHRPRTSSTARPATQRAPPQPTPRPL